MQQLSPVPHLVEGAKLFDRKTLRDEVEEETAQVNEEKPVDVAVVAGPQNPVPTEVPTPVPQLDVPVPGDGLPSNISSAWPEEIQRWGGLLTKYADEQGVDPDLVAAVMYRESWFPKDTYPAGYSRCPDGPSTTSCTSSAGAIGMMQVMPFHVENTGENLRDAETNIRKGVAILAGYISYMGEVRGGLAAYNAGPTGASNGGGWGYADKVLDAYQTFKR